MRERLQMLSSDILLFEMMFEYMNENYPNVLSEMIQCAVKESSE